MGAPASVKRSLSDQDVAWKQAGTREYQELAKRCLTQMQVCEPLSEPEPDRPRISDRGLRPKGSSR
ncbi:Carnitine operon protein CaiE [compost metagenome]